MHDSRSKFSIQSLDKKTFPNLIVHGANFLKSHNLTNCKNEIKWFLEHLLQCNKTNLYSNILINPKDYNRINNFLNQRVKGIPFQQLINKASFYGRDFIINTDVLIPRPETEALIDLIKHNKYNKMLDIGTGSGIIAITANLENIASSIDAIDIDPKALKVAKKNQVKLQASKVNFFKMDILKMIPEAKYDIVVSNPPYVSLPEYNQLDVMVKDYEPIQALTDFKDGLTFYKRYAIILKEILNENGVAFFELSHMFNKEDLKKIFINFQNIKFYNDLNEDCRFIKITS